MKAHRPGGRAQRPAHIPDRAHALHLGPHQLKVQTSTPRWPPLGHRRVSKRHNQTSTASSSIAYPQGRPRGGTGVILPDYRAGEHNATVSSPSSSSTRQCTTGTAEGPFSIRTPTILSGRWLRNESNNREPSIHAITQWVFFAIITFLLICLKLMHWTPPMGL